MKTVTEIFDVFTFDELPENVQDKVVTDFQDINVDFEDWHDFVLEDFKEELGKLGWQDVDTSYTGFWSQGDGASWSGRLHSTEVPGFIKMMGWKKYNPLALAINKGKVESHFAIIKYGHYSHEYTMHTEYCEFYNLDMPDNSKLLTKLEELYEQLERDILEWARDKARELYRKLEDEYTYLTSNESVIECIKANEYEFTIDGKLYR